MNVKQIQEYLTNAKATKFAIDIGIVGNWNDVINEVSSLDHGDQDRFMIMDGALQGKELEFCNNEFKFLGVDYYDEF